MGKAKDALGIDLGSSSIKVVRLRRAGNTVAIDHASVVPVRRSADDPYSIDQPDLLLRAHLLSAGVRAGAMVCGVDRGLATVRSLRLPPASGSEMDNMVRYEAETLIPFPLEAVQLVYAVTGREGDTTHALVAALR